MDDSSIDADLRVATSAMDAAKAMARSGDLAGARAAFLQMVHNDPEDEDAWLWLAYVAESKEASLDYLREAAALMPRSERIAEGLRWAHERLGRTPSASSAEGAAAQDATPKRARPKGPARSEWRAPDPEQVAATVAEVADRARGAVTQVVKGAVRAAFSVNAAGERPPRQRPVADEAAAERAPEQPAPTLTMAEEDLHVDPVGELGPDLRPSRRPRLDPERLRSLGMGLVTGLSIVAVLIFAYLGIVHARSLPRKALALELPTPIPSPTVTPTIPERTQPFWIQADVAWTRQDWDGAVQALEHIRAVDPDSQEARMRLGEAYYYRGLLKIQENKLEEARLELDDAVRLNSASKDLQQIRRDLKTYLLGLDAYWAKDWPRVVEYLEKVQRRRPDFRDTREMLGQAYYQVGIERQASEVWDEARDSFKSALDLLPELEDAEVRLQEVMDVLIPPRRIVVDLSDKLCTVYENHQPIQVYPVCTGRDSAPTLPGRYLIQSKMPEAYASKWDLRMPWWLGIYWAGGSENGFHALPILSNGTILWRSALGTGCSYGCIVLDTEDALWLYKWAEIGTVVLVNP